MGEGMFWKRKSTVMEWDFSVLHMLLPFLLTQGSGAQVQEHLVMQHKKFAKSTS